MNLKKFYFQTLIGKMLKHLEATMLIVDKDLIVELDGTGNVHALRSPSNFYYLFNLLFLFIFSYLRC